MFEKLTKRLARAATRAVKEETVQSLDDLVPVLVGLASVAGVLVGMFGQSKPVGTTITINNYYGRG